MKQHFNVFISAILLFFVTFIGFGFASGTVDDSSQISDLLSGRNDPTIPDFLAYLVATLTGLAAVFLRKLIKKLFPNWEEPPKKR